MSTRWCKILEIMDEIHKGQKQYTGREEKIIWTALFFQPGFGEVANDLGKGQIEKGQRYITSLLLSF